MENWYIIIASFGLACFLAGILAGKSMGGRLKGEKSSKDRGARSRKKSKKSVELYVGNLPYSINDKALAETFEPHGKVHSARVIKDRFNGKSKGFGFVEMGSKSDADKAVDALDGQNVSGRRVVVNEAKAKAK